MLGECRTDVCLQVPMQRGAEGRDMSRRRVAQEAGFGLGSSFEITFLPIFPTLIICITKLYRPVLLNVIVYMVYPDSYTDQLD